MCARRLRGLLLQPALAVGAGHQPGPRRHARAGQLPGARRGGLGAAVQPDAAHCQFQAAGEEPAHHRGCVSVIVCVHPQSIFRHFAHVACGRSVEIQEDLMEFKTEQFAFRFFSSAERRSD